MANRLAPRSQLHEVEQKFRMVLFWHTFSCKCTRNSPNFKKRPLYRSALQTLNDSQLVRLEKPVFTAILCGGSCIIGLLFVTKAGSVGIRGESLSINSFLVLGGFVRSIHGYVCVVVRSVFRNHCRNLCIRL